ncbi:hypothetical protein Y717_04150 [Streptomyces scopuliridis RB72]|uniref:Acetone carboxylase n=1 Tax=Streptomyces scopuliridis RB72 TaxID=1440053 RepID=A0A2T7T8H5_9ACTN|nr:hypothetical protein Y717_04150 [Streptomyces scopuliridis RB72]
MNFPGSPSFPGSPGFPGAPGSPEGPADDAAPICSAKGCRAPAVWVLAWNNPKLHTPERRKTWLACDEHREHLSSFLGMRGFLKDVVELTEWERNSATDR